jgi:hypothetical protein
MKSFTIDFDYLGEHSSEVVFANTKVEAIKSFLKGYKELEVVILNVYENGRIRTYQKI